MNKDHQELSDLIQACLDDRASDEQITRLNAKLRSDSAARDLYLRLADTHSCLAVDESLWMDDIADGRAFKAPTRQSSSFNWLNWRPIAAAAAGLVMGMFCTSVVFAYTQPRSPVVVSKALPLADADFESGSQVPAQGIPSSAGAWSGDYSRVVEAENGITPKHGQNMLRFLRSDNERSSKNERSFVGEMAQVIDLRPLRAELSGADQLVEVSAQFNSIATPPGAKYEFNVKAAVFRGDIADAPRLWEDHEASLSRSARTVVADSEVATWQRVAMPLVVPLDADFLVIEAAVVFKGAQSAQSVAEFPGHYVDQVEVRLTGSANAWAVTHNAN
jgi:hypothetical protein